MILDSELNKIIKYIFPLYEDIDEANKKIVWDSYKNFLEENLKNSFEEYHINKTKEKKMTSINKGYCFVFGSNLSGIHGAGSARIAYEKYNAHWGVGEGLTGQAYALPTKGKNISFMPLSEVKEHVDKFKKFAQVNPGYKFRVTCVGCGLAGFTDSEIAPLFIGSPENCYFDTKWKDILGLDMNYWGTF